MVGKRGSEKYYIIISLILGLMVLGLSLYFIFQEYFTQDDINWETCRQSIVLRNSVPESERIATTSIEKLKENFPLKCKTEVIEIEMPEFSTKEGVYEKNLNEIMKKIADSMLSCHQLFGGGNYKIYPINYLKERKDCPICYRIHFTAKEPIQKEVTIPLLEYLISHDLKGNLLSRDEFGKEKSYSYNLRYNRHDKFVFATNDKWEQDDWGMRDVIYPSKGDVLIGMYFYSNREVRLFGNEKYQGSYVFYIQPELDYEEFNTCSIDSIPA